MLYSIPIKIFNNLTNISFFILLLDKPLQKKVTRLSYTKNINNWQLMKYKTKQICEEIVFCCFYFQKVQQNNKILTQKKIINNTNWQQKQAGRQAGRHCGGIQSTKYEYSKQKHTLLRSTTYIHWHSHIHTHTHTHTQQTERTKHALTHKGYNKQQSIYGWMLCECFEYLFFVFLLSFVFPILRITMNNDSVITEWRTQTHTHTLAQNNVAKSYGNCRWKVNSAYWHTNYKRRKIKSEIK